MENFYSIVYVAPNHLTNERLSVGLLVVINGVPRFEYSMTKIKWLSYDLIKAPVKNHLKEIEEIIAEEQKSKVMRLFNYRFAKEVFEDLSKKSRGMIVFDSPRELLTELDSKAQDKLFMELIGAKPKKTAEKKQLPMRVKWTHWLRRQEGLKGEYQFSLEDHSWVKVDYAHKVKNTFKIYHCIDPETSKKSFNQSMEKMSLYYGIIEQQYPGSELILVHGNTLSKTAKKNKEKFENKNWLTLDQAKEQIA